MLILLRSKLVIERSKRGTRSNLKDDRRLRTPRPVRADLRLQVVYKQRSVVIVHGAQEAYPWSTRLACRSSVKSTKAACMQGNTQSDSMVSWCRLKFAMARRAQREACTGDLHVKLQDLSCLYITSLILQAHLSAAGSAINMCQQLAGLGPNTSRATKLALELHAHSVQYACGLAH
eukprot:263182-Pelagomonas_calceolata.AAC.2